MMKERVKNMKWLHISDIHFNINGYESNQLKEKLKSKLREMGQEMEFILITGDCLYQYKGGTREQKDIIEFIKEIAKICYCRNNRIYICPGNHDVSRSDENRNKLVTEIRNNKHNFSTSYNELRELGNEKFQTIYKGITGRDYEAYKVFSPQDAFYRIVSINTCFLSLDNCDKGRLKVCNEKLATIQKQIKNDNKINILIMHHGPEWLEVEDARKFEHWIEDNYIDVVHCGHTHRAAVETYDDIFRDVKQFTAGALMMDSYAIPSFYVCESDDSLSKIELNLYTYSKEREEWVIDNQHLRKFKNGRYQYALSRKTVDHEDTTVTRSVSCCRTMVEEFNRRYIEKFGSNKIYSNRYDGSEEFDAWKIIHSLAEIGMNYAQALELTNKVIDEVTATEFKSVNTILSCKELRTIVYGAITSCRASDVHTEFDVSCWASRYARRYNRNEEIIILRSYGEKQKLNCNYIKNVLLREVVDRITGNSIFYEKIIGNELTRMSENILGFLKNMGIFEIKSEALIELVTEYITQKPHPWLINGNRETLLSYHYEQSEKHINMLEENSEGAILQTEAAYHICAAFLARYDDYIGCTEISPIIILLKAINGMNNKNLESLNVLPMQKYQIVQLKKDLEHINVNFDDFRQDINILYQNIVSAKRITLEETKEALVDLWGILRKLEQRIVVSDIHKSESVRYVTNIFSCAKGFICKIPLRDLKNCFWVEPNWEQYEIQQQHLGKQLLVCILDRNSLWGELDEICSYLYQQKRRTSITELVFVLKNCDSFSGELRRQIRERLKGKYVRCVFLQEENFAQISENNGWREIFYKVICISKIS